MTHVWDYSVEELKKSSRGKLLLLERKINGGVYLSDEEKISLKNVRENWDRLQIDPAKRRVLEMLIWGK
jgi:hypothetical protein